MAGYKISFSARLIGIDGMRRRIKKSDPALEHCFAVQYAKDTSPYVPADSLSLDERTRVDGRHVIYGGPYARMQRAGKVMVDAETGKGPAHYIDAAGNEVTKFRRGATLKATTRDLEYGRSVHRKATAYWDEASKRDNIEKWKRIMKKEVLRYGRG